MNDADLILGKKKHVDMPAAKRSPFARYPDVQELCDTFIEEMEWNTDPYTIKQIAAGARDFKRAIGAHHKEDEASQAVDCQPAQLHNDSTQG